MKSPKTSTKETSEPTDRISRSSTYIPTLPFFPGDSRFLGISPVLPLHEISRFQCFSANGNGNDQFVNVYACFKENMFKCLENCKFEFIIIDNPYKMYTKEELISSTSHVIIKHSICYYIRFDLLYYIIIFSEDLTDRKRDEYFLTGGSERSCVASKCIIYFLVFSKFLQKFPLCWVIKNIPSLHML